MSLTPEELKLIKWKNLPTDVAWSAARKCVQKFREVVVSMDDNAYPGYPFSFCMIIDKKTGQAFRDYTPMSIEDAMKDLAQMAIQRSIECKLYDTPSKGRVVKPEEFYESDISRDDDFLTINYENVFLKIYFAVEAILEGYCSVKITREDDLIFAFYDGDSECCMVKSLNSNTPGEVEKFVNLFLTGDEKTSYPETCDGRYGKSTLVLDIEDYCEGFPVCRGGE